MPKNTLRPLARSTLTLRGVARTAIKPPASPAPALTPPANAPVERFHFVWSPSRRRPRQRHTTREAASAEAARLAQLTPGTVFCVYSAIEIERHIT